MMKSIGIAGAALVALVVGTGAIAQPPGHVVTRTTTTTTTHRESGVRMPVVHRRHKVCTVRWRHHQRVRTCTWR